MASSEAGAILPGFDRYDWRGLLMPHSAAYDEYLESQVLTADPLELVRLLYTGALDAVRCACNDLSAGRIAERSRHIGKAEAILNQLALSLDHARGGTLSHSLT